MEDEFIMEKLAIYVHIPFCKQKCKYCDFTSFSGKEEIKQQYIDALCKEIRASKTEKYLVTSVYFGGGTPSFIHEKLLEKVLNTIRKNYIVDKNAEITLEANPGTVNSEKLKFYRKIGFNRISFGVQAVQDEILKEIGRIHSAKEAIEGFYMAREVGFSNISLDLMFGLPNQKLEDVQETLNTFIDLKPEHISTYSLKVEEATVFGKMQREGRLKLPDENEEREMYYLIKKVLKENGYCHYEISNFAKPGFESRHNTAYWERQNYLGFGVGASSCFNEVRFSNTEKLEEYIENPIKNFREEEVLTDEAIASEKIFLGLRMLKGIDKKLIINKEWERSVKKLTDEGLLVEENGIISLTDRGLDLANQVFVEFV